MGMVSLGTVADLMDATFTGFDYPQNAQVVGLLAKDSSGGNAVLQQSGLGFRQATLALWAEDADMATIRGYYETREAITFTDFDGATSTVRLLDFTRSLKLEGLWDVTVTMLEIVPPAGAGS